VIGPETNEPMETFKTGWMVPVDLTLAMIWPRESLAVRHWVRFRWLK
jgi:hypothetical protein